MAEAEQASPDVVRLEEIIVTATKTEKRAEEVPASVTVVTQAEMERRNIGSADGGYPTTNKSGNSRWVAGDKGDNGAEGYSIDAKAVYDFSDTGKLSATAVSGHHEYDYGPPEAFTSDDSLPYPPRI